MGPPLPRTVRAHLPPRPHRPRRSTAIGSAIRRPPILPLFTSGGWKRPTFRPQAAFSVFPHAVRLALHRPPARSTVVLVGVPSYDEALRRAEE